MESIGEMPKLNYEISSYMFTLCISCVIHSFGKFLIKSWILLAEGRTTTPAGALCSRQTLVQPRTLHHSTSHTHAYTCALYQHSCNTHTHTHTFTVWWATPTHTQSVLSIRHWIENPLTSTRQRRWRQLALPLPLPLGLDVAPTVSHGWRARIEGPPSAVYFLEQ